MNQETALNTDLVSWPEQAGWPHLESVQRHGSDRVEFTLSVPENCHWFDGHFPAHPVLPGVVQLHWASQIAGRVWKELESGREVQNLKFQKLVLPGATLCLNLEYQRPQMQVRFRFSQKADTCSQGRICFHTGAGP